MSKVFANGREVAAKAQDNKVIAAFPDVCMTPPENPATPPGIPVPYPSFGQDSDTEQGTATVKIGDETVTHKNKSDYSKSTGTEAGAATKKGVVSSANTGKEYAQSWSNDVKADGQPVTRNADIATINHSAEKPPNAASVQVGAVGPGSGSAPITQCPCCKKSPAHANQVKADGTMCETTPESEYYGERMRRANEKINMNMGTMERNDPRWFGIWKQYTERKKAYETVTNARKSGSKCPNLHEEDKDCGVHFKGTRNASEILEQDNPAEARAIESNPKYAGDARKISRAKHNFVREKILGITDSVKKRIIDRDGKGDGKNKGVVHHLTPISAGGCPTSENNLLGQGKLTDPECDAVNEAQGVLQTIEEA